MTAEKESDEAGVEEEVESVGGSATSGVEDGHVGSSEPEMPQPEGGVELSDEPPEGESYAAPGVDLEIEELREQMRREFQSNKDREIQRERRRWESELETQRNEGRPERRSQDDAAGGRGDHEGYEAHIDALGTTFVGLGGRLRELPDMAKLQDADWDALLRTGDFEEFVKDAVELSAKRKSDVGLQEKAEELATARIKAKLASMRSTEVGPDLMPPGVPAVGFDRLEERYVAGEIDINRYRAARRREGLQD